MKANKPAMMIWTIKLKDSSFLIAIYFNERNNLFDLFDNATYYSSHIAAIEAAAKVGKSRKISDWKQYFTLDSRAI